jgi:hypothetical protein
VRQRLIRKNSDRVSDCVEDAEVFDLLFDCKDSFMDPTRTGSEFAEMSCSAPTTTVQIEPLQQSHVVAGSHVTRRVRVGQVGTMQWNSRRRKFDLL